MSEELTEGMFNEFIREKDNRLRLTLNEKYAEDYVKNLKLKEEAISLLKELEWTGLHHMTYHSCYICGCLKPGEPRDKEGLPEYGHTADCRLKKFLDEVEK